MFRLSIPVTNYPLLQHCFPHKTPTLLPQLLALKPFSTKKFGAFEECNKNLTAANPPKLVYFKINSIREESNKNPTATNPSNQFSANIYGSMGESSQNQTDRNPQLSTETDFPKPITAPPPKHSKQIEFDRAMCAEAAVKAGPALTKNEIIYEDDWLIAVNKPSGVYCEHVLSSIPDLLVSSPRYTGAKNDAISLELHLANRLDRDTSGVMVITKRHRIAGKLVQAFTDRKVRKTYLALCIGPAPKWSEVYIESGHGRSKFGAWRVYSRKDVGRVLPEGCVVREMATRLRVLSVNGNHKLQHIGHEESQNCFNQFAFDSTEGQFITFEGDESADSVENLVVSEQNSENVGQVCDFVNSPDILKSDEVLVRAYPQSGRTHQIRLHCQYLGLPIRGDVKYEGPHVWKGITYASHALHAESLCFEHPVTQTMVKLYAPLPQWAVEAYGCSSLKGI
ncbi:RNA pseudouridine synthase 1 isoform X2 [Cryptomeria japonica]|uniref:RNA pseudouridine synthase 1 isoform X2 n=1 Tax=Cryptomeria japonica TaxID=3369 RepID=UPI0027DA6FF7|nr:RNA pseudouridine synthase 1 isoform X2 [Cryptomeria japonica]